jgi:hypothetical protein
VKTLDIRAPLDRKPAIAPAVLCVWLLIGANIGDPPELARGKG